MPDPAGLDGVEVYNHGNLRGEQDPGWNDQALAFARVEVGKGEEA